MSGNAIAAILFAVYYISGLVAGLFYLRRWPDLADEGGLPYKLMVTFVLLMSTLGGYFVAGFAVRRAILDHRNPLRDDLKETLRLRRALCGVAGSEKEREALDATIKDLRRYPAQQRALRRRGEGAALMANLAPDIAAATQLANERLGAYTQIDEEVADQIQPGQLPPTQP